MRSAWAHLKNNTDVLPKRVDILEGQLQGDSVGVEIGTILQPRREGDRVEGRSPEQPGLQSRILAA